jgi:cytosine/adenosine deaminase-related metal-dependent hydrolase
VILRARWILPIDRPPLENGWIRVRDGLIDAIGSGTLAGPDVRDVGDAVILPGLINAHTHLELSWMKGRVPSGPSMGAWIGALMALRRSAPLTDDEQRAAAAEALRDARAGGTSGFGDISNSLSTADLLADSGTPAVVFHEVLGFMPHDAAERAAAAAARVITAVRPPATAGLSPHAPYSVSPDLFRAVTREIEARGLPSSVHLGESEEEVEFLQTGRGAIAEILRGLGAWNASWSPPATGPAEYMDRLGVLRPGLLVVHATQLSSVQLALVARRGCAIVSCPRSNRWVGAGDPPIDAFYASGAPVAFGTDSLASAPDLDMFAELAAARAVSTVPARQILESATRRGAEVLGFGSTLGTLAPGKAAAVIAVDVPPGVKDVEEYLLTGIRPSAVRWPGHPVVEPQS